MAEPMGTSSTAAPGVIRDYGLVRFVGNKEIQEKDRIARENKKIQDQQPLSNLLQHMMHLWEAAKDAKWPIDERLAKCIRAKKGKYDPDDLNAIRQFGGSEIYMMLTNVKSRSIEAQIKDIMLPAGEQPWSIDPSEVPSLPQEIVERVVQQLQSELMELMAAYGDTLQITPQMVDLRMAELMDEARSEIRKVANNECTEAEQHVEDLLQEGGFYDELRDFIKDFSTYLTAFIRGPFVVREKKLKWTQRPNGTSFPAFEYQPVLKYKRVSPFDIFPLPANKSLHEGLFERMRIRPSELNSYQSSDGFFKPAIQQTLLEHRRGNLTNWLWTDQERANIENRHQEITDPTSMIECLLFHGEVPGDLLAQYGIKTEGNISDPVAISMMFSGSNVLMVRINKHPLGWVPYYSASFDPSSDSIWGNAPPELMEDCQRMCNTAARAIQNNMGMASGPQVEVFMDRIDPSQGTGLHPWKTWKTNSDNFGSGKPAVNFYQPNLVTKELMEVFNFFYAQSGEQLGVPAYDQGSEVNTGGAGSTAHGLAMLMSASSKIMKEAIGNIDDNVIKKIVFQTWLHAITAGIMDYTGDIHIVARASEYLIVAEQLQARRQEFLAFTNNPIDLAIIGLDGRATVLRETAKSLKLDGQAVVPPEWEINAMMGNMQQGGQEQPQDQPGPSGPSGPPQPGQQISEAPLNQPAYEEPIGGAPPVPPLERMANL